MIALLLFLAFQPPATPAYQQATSLLQNGNYPAAAEAFQALYEQAPTNPWYAQGLGLSLASQKDYTLAVTPLAHACNALPPPSSACYQWGRALYYLDRFEAALQAFSLAAQRGNTPAPALLSSRAQALEGLNRTSEAEALYRNALKLPKLTAEDAAPLHLRLGLLEYRRAALPAAISHFQQATTLAPAWPPAFKELARAQLQSGSPQSALPAIEQAIRLGDSSRESVYLLSRILQRLGRTEEAAQAQARAAALK